jgi:hypothetical protein
MIREFNQQWDKDYVWKTIETLQAQSDRRKSVVEKNDQRDDIDETRQWEKVEVMKRKTGNLRTTMGTGRGVEFLSNGQEQNGERYSASTSELV